MEEGRRIPNGFASEQAIGSKSPGEKRNGNGFGEGNEFGSKRVKVRDLVSDLAVSDEATAANLKSVGDIGQSTLSSEEKFGGTAITVVPDSEASDNVGREKDALPIYLKSSTARAVLETSKCVDNTRSVSTNDNESIAYFGKQPLAVENSVNDTSRRELSLDLKVGDVSRLDKHDLSSFPKNSTLLKARGISESECSDRAAVESDPVQGWAEMKRNCLLQYTLSEKAGPLQLDNLASTLGESDSMRRWKEMKRNGFLSGPLGGAAVSSSVVSSSSSIVLSSGDMPVHKQQKSKRKSDGLKKKKEHPKREQADRFSNIAAPSGLLKELNPGIINYVRNKKQVCSIIKSLVRIGTEDVREESLIDSNSRGISDFSQGNVSLADSNLRREHLQSACDHPITVSEGMVEPRMADSVREDGRKPFKLSSTEASENASSIENVHSFNSTSPTPILVEAATVASQWLELLHQDIRGRLSALEHSKNRVQSILTTELPLLDMSGQENTPKMMNTSRNEFSCKTMMEHQTRWFALFDQMNKALSDEKTDLECWLKQVKEMQSHCDEGLRHIDLASTVSSQSSGVSETGSRLEKDGSVETSLAVQAAAASIYSTCSFLLSTRNSSCSLDVQSE